MEAGLLYYLSYQDAHIISTNRIINYNDDTCIGKRQDSTDKQIWGQEFRIWKVQNLTPGIIYGQTKNYAKYWKAVICDKYKYRNSITVSNLTMPLYCKCRRLSVVT